MNVALPSKTKKPTYVGFFVFIGYSAIFPHFP